MVYFGRLNDNECSQDVFVNICHTLCFSWYLLRQLVRLSGLDYVVNMLQNHKDLVWIFPDTVTAQVILVAGLYLCFNSVLWDCFSSWI